MFFFRELLQYILELFAKLWSALNKSSPDIGMCERSIFRDPVRQSDD